MEKSKTESTERENVRSSLEGKQSSAGIVPQQCESLNRVWVNEE